MYARTKYVTRSITHHCSFISRHAIINSTSICYIRIAYTIHIAINTIVRSSKLIYQWLLPQDMRARTYNISSVSRRHDSAPQLLYITLAETYKTQVSWIPRCSLTCQSPFLRNHRGPIRSPPIKSSSPTTTKSGLYSDTYNPKKIILFALFNVVIWH